MCVNLSPVMLWPFDRVRSSRFASSNAIEIFDDSQLDEGASIESIAPGGPFFVVDGFLCIDRIRSGAVEIRGLIGLLPVVLSPVVSLLEALPSPRERGMKSKPVYPEERLAQVKVNLGIGSRIGDLTEAEIDSVEKEFQAVHRTAKVNKGEPLKVKFDELWSGVSTPTKTLQWGKDIDRKLMLLDAWLKLGSDFMHVKDAEGRDLDPPVKWLADDAHVAWSQHEYLRDEKAWDAAVDALRKKAEAEAERKAEAAAAARGDGAPVAAVDPGIGGTEEDDSCGEPYLGQSEQAALMRNAKAAREAQQDDEGRAEGKDTPGEEQAVGGEAPVVHAGEPGVSGTLVGSAATAEFLEDKPPAAEEPAATARDAAEYAAATTRRCAG